jgi:AAA family ATP:ADP antiporter
VNIDYQKNTPTKTTTNIQGKIVFLARQKHFLVIGFMITRNVTLIDLLFYQKELLSGGHRQNPKVMRRCMSQLRLTLKSLWSIKPEYKQKVFFLSLTFLLMSSCLVIWRPLKMAVFSKMIGAYHVPDAKLYSLFFIIPLILLYSKLVDWLRRHHLLYCFTIFHAVGGLIFAYLLAHPVYGIANTEINTNRWIGWFFYFFMESFDAFFSTTFWSFADSVNNPKDAKNYYGFFVSGSKIGGIVSAGLLYLLLTTSSTQNQIVFLPGALVVGSLLLLAAALAIRQLVKTVPDDVMHGYEAAYKFETQKKPESQSFLQSLRSSVDGLLIMIKRPYVLGIFSLVAFYEIMIVIFDWWVALHADAASPTVGSMTAYYAFYYFLMNLVGLVISFFGTTPLLRVVGARVSLFLFPIMCLGLLFITYLFPTANMFFVVLVGLRSLNYALNHPTREVLYIPTTKDIKFKAKTWTDAFGSRIAKSFGSVFNVTLKGATPAVALLSSLSLSFGLTFLWIIIVYFLGKTLQDAIDNKKVIGLSEEPSNNIT